MTNAAPASMPDAKTATDASSRVVTSSVTPASVSVFSVTRPSPGKCLIATSTPDASIPALNAFAWEVTVSGVEP